MVNQTIVSLITPNISSAISVIRISGPQAFEIVGLLCKKKLTKKGYTFVKEYIYDNNNVVDEVIILKFVAPRSFTGEDVIEINCHGGILVSKKILQLILENGARLAEKGEFTKQAFLNNKLNLKQAHSINNLINAKSSTSMKLGINGIINDNQTFFYEMKEALFNLIGKIEVNIDYPEYDDVEQVAINDYYFVVNEIKNKLTKLKNDYEKISYLYKGINVAIVGKPNVGKSSLLNALLNKDRAIVSNIKGTTRDVIEESITLNNVLLNFIDTAGIRKTKDKIEKIGIQKSLDAIKKADLVLFVVDQTKKMDNDEKTILKKIKNKKYIIVKNKSDLKKDVHNDPNMVSVSSAKKKIDNLILAIEKMFTNNDFDLANNLSICSDNEFYLIKEILLILNKSLKNAKNNYPIDVLVEDITLVYKKICIILGETNDLDIIDKMFKNFCLGK